MDKVFKTLGATSHSLNEREENDFYATDPKALELLLQLETFNKVVWEPACGQGHLSEVLKNCGYTVISTDLYDRNYGTGGIDFLSCTKLDYPFYTDVDIITNPPYRYAQQFVEKSLELISDNCRVAVFLRTLFLESKTRKELFQKYPPQYIYVSSSRIKCAINGDFNALESSALSYSWFIWKKGYTGETIVRWFN